MPAPEWSEDIAVEGERLWRQGKKSCAEIAAALGVSKSALIGKAHRMGWPAKPSPVRSFLGAWTDAERQTLIDRPTWTDEALVVMLPGRTAGAIQGKRSELRLAGLLGGEKRPSFLPAPLPDVGPLPVADDFLEPGTPLSGVYGPPPPPVPPRKGEQCNWLDGDLPRFVRCTADAVDGKNGRPTYCRVHFNRVYQRVFRRGNAA